MEKPPVLFRKARDHIGIQVHEPFDEEKHRQEDYFVCPIEGARARCQMRWSVERVSGDIVQQMNMLTSL